MSKGDFSLPMPVSYVKTGLELGHSYAWSWPNNEVCEASGGYIYYLAWLQIFLHMDDFKITNSNQNGQIDLTTYRVQSLVNLRQYIGM